ncbi:protein DpdE [Amycolatopsis nigrescens]|uniref:protein DpdE n=1 Tax=Amycolatopsis nigrescens TaxID=381445 RepID=UPI0012F77024|nr:protein DpdE [Amycolatopsis nigrescens]
MNGFIGQWVRVSDNDLGFGFCKAKRDNDSAVVVYTDVPRVSETEVVVPASRLTAPKVSPGTRVWLPGDVFGWRSGEITSASGFGEYWVRLAGSGQDVKVHGSKLLIRWNGQLRDPVAALKSGLCDSPEYYAARKDFRDRLIEQRSASRGFTAVLSAPVALYQHQLDTVARVLADPVLRYLLADEVGLGKTVEAGLVLRQLLLDNSDFKALVCAPSTLVQQWRDELSERLLLGSALLEKRLKIISHEQLLRHGDLRDVGLVVIDEAHQVVERLSSFEVMRRNLQNARGLLLLSATPMKGNLPTFLGLLNLVDPSAFPLDNVVEFRKRVELRESAAQSVQALISHRSTLRRRLIELDRLTALHRSDQVIVKLADACRATGDVASPMWAKLADYVRETYRISRRMIRHRRDVGPAVGYPVSGRQPTFVPLEDPARPDVDDFLDAYRERLAGRLDHDFYARTVMRGLGGPAPLLVHLESALRVKGLIPADMRPLVESTIARLQLVGIDARVRRALEVVAERVAAGQKVVLVATSVHTATRLLELARSRWGSKVRGHLQGMAQQEADDDVIEFLESRTTQLLVGDYSIEEGRNLQNADVLVNVDLPLDLNRLEQRIGRLDRFARGSGPAEVVVLTESGSSWVTAQLAMLNEGIGIFDSSVAALQRRLAEVRDRLIEALGEDGSSAFTHDLGELRFALDEERKEVDLLEELESVTVAADFDEVGLSDLRAVDGNEEELRQAFARLTSVRGGVALRPDEDERGILRFRPNSRRSGQTRIDRVGGLSEDASREVVGLLERTYSYSRDVAVSRRDVSLLRLGDPLVDWLERYLRQDERGRTRAIVRRTGAVWSPELWLHCEFLVEYDDSHIDATDEGTRRRLRRRGDAHLAPTIVQTWTDVHGTASTELQAVLDPPFDERRGDHVLSGHRWKAVLKELPEWRQLCEASYGEARAHLMSTPALTSVPSIARERAVAEMKSRLDVLRARVRRLPTRAERMSAESEKERETVLGNALVKGVGKPAVSLISCGGVVLWPER